VTQIIVIIIPWQFYLVLHRDSGMFMFSAASGYQFSDVHHHIYFTLLSYQCKLNQQFNNLN